MRVKNGEMRGRMRGREDKEGEGTILSLEAKKESKKPALVKLLGCVNGERHCRISNSNRWQRASSFQRFEFEMLIRGIAPDLADCVSDAAEVE